MSRLQPGVTPGSPIMARPVKAPVKPSADPEPYVYECCDLCGYSVIDGQPIASAKARIYVRAGNLYLCGHHLRINLPYILEHGYYFRSLV